MTDNAFTYIKNRSPRDCSPPRDVRHLCTQFHRPRTNGKAERFIKTMVAGWNDGAICGSSRERAAPLDGWLWTYNHRRSHGARNHKSPIARLDELNNPPGLYS